MPYLSWSCGGRVGFLTLCSKFPPLALLLTVVFVSFMFFLLFATPGFVRYCCPTTNHLNIPLLPSKQQTYSVIPCFVPANVREALAGRTRIVCNPGWL